MKKLILLAILFLCISAAKAQINIYSVFFNKEGRLSHINSKEFYKGSGLASTDKKELQIKVSITSEDSLLRAHYKPYFEKQLTLIDSLGQPKIQAELKTYYGFTDLDIKKFTDENKCYVKYFPKELKNLYGYPNLTMNPSSDCKDSPIFNPYNIIVTGYPLNPDAEILVQTSTANVFFNNWITYTLTLNSTKVDLNRVDYDVFFNKPEAQHFGASISEFPSQAYHDETKEKIKQANTIIGKVNELNKLSIKQDSLGIGDRGTFLDDFTKYYLELAVLNKDISQYFISNHNVIKQWMWYTQGKPLLNPFAKTVVQSKVGEITGKLERFRQDSISIAANFRETEKKYQYFKDITQAQFVTEKTLTSVNAELAPKVLSFLGNLKKLQISADTVNKKIDSLRLKIKAIKKQESEEKEINDPDFFNKDIFLYEGHTFPGKVGGLERKNHFVYYRNYDRSDNLSPFQKLPGAYDETASVYLLIENETKKNNFLSFAKPLTDVSNFTSVVGAAADELKVTALIENPFESENKSGGIEGDSTSFVARLDSVLLRIKRLSIRIAYFAKKLQPPPPYPKSFETDPTPAYKTDYHLAVFPDTSKTSYALSTVVAQDKRRDTLTFRVNKLFYVLPTIGLAYSSAPRPEVILNSDGSIDKTEYYNGFNLMMGFKFFPFGTSIYDPKFIVSQTRRPVFDYRKIHLIGGVNLFKPLKQFYLGAGIDLWSGFSINGGGYLVSKKQSQLVRQKLESKSYVDTDWYFSVNVDVSLAIKLINLLKR